MAMALYGLQRLTGSSPEEGRLLHILAEKLEASPWPLRGQEAAMAVYGLQVRQ